METKTVLAKIITQYWPTIGTTSNLLIDIRGVKPEQILVERGNTTDKNIELAKKDFCFLKLVDSGQYYKIDKVVPVDNFILTSQLLTINGVK